MESNRVPSDKKPPILFPIICAFWLLFVVGMLASSALGYPYNEPLPNLPVLTAVYTYPIFFILLLLFSVVLTRKYRSNQQRPGPFRLAVYFWWATTVAYLVVAVAWYELMHH